MNHGLAMEDLHSEKPLTFKHGQFSKPCKLIIAHRIAGMICSAVTFVESFGAWQLTLGFLEPFEISFGLNSAVKVCSRE